MRILIQFPTFRRRDKFLNCLSKYVDLASGNNGLFFNINCDYHDETMNNFETMEEIYEIVDDNAVAINFDKNTTKIGAINANINPDSFDVLVCASDDMIPQIYGWDDEIALAMTTHFPNMDGAIHFNDGNKNADKLITLSVMGVELYKHFGYVYHPDYKSLYCDNEFTEEVYRLGQVVYVDKVIIKHEHYSIDGNSNSGDYDVAAEKTLKFSGRDGVVFGQRKQMGFPSYRITND